MKKSNGARGSAKTARGRGDGPVKLDEVAKAAGVSPSTVSRILNGTASVSEAKKKGLAPAVTGMPIHIGGPVDSARGFVLHSGEYTAKESTLAIDERVSLTVTIDILKAIAAGKGPARSFLALGYAGWDGGQLEREIQSNGWLNCPADEDLVFDTDIASKYERALLKLGVHPTHLSSEAGHA